MELSGEVFRFGGFVLAHSASIASEQGEGELICPFIVIAKDQSRQAIPFEADTQAESLDNAMASLEQYRDHVDFWSCAREGLYSEMDDGAAKVDVLVVSAWTQGMRAPIEIIQRFRPNFPGPFSLHGDVDVFIDGNAQKEHGALVVRALVGEGINRHPRGKLWSPWGGAVYSW